MAIIETCWQNYGSCYQKGPLPSFSLDRTEAFEDLQCWTSASPHRLSHHTVGPPSLHYYKANRLRKVEKREEESGPSGVKIERERNVIVRWWPKEIKEAEREEEAGGAWERERERRVRAKRGRRRDWRREGGEEKEGERSWGTVQLCERIKQSLLCQGLNTPAEDI